MTVPGPSSGCRLGARTLEARAAADQGADPAPQRFAAIAVRVAGSPRVELLEEIAGSLEENGDEILGTHGAILSAGCGWISWAAASDACLSSCASSGPTSAVTALKT